MGGGAKYNYICQNLIKINILIYRDGTGLALFKRPRYVPIQPAEPPPKRARTEDEAEATGVHNNMKNLCVAKSSFTYPINL